MKKIVSLLIGLFITLAIAACGGNSSPEAAAKAFTEAVYSGDSQKVISMIYLSEKDKKEAGVQDILSGKIKMSVSHEKEVADKNGGLKNISIEGIKYDDDKKSAHVQISVTFKNTEQIKKKNLYLIKTDDGWKVKG